MASIGAMIIKRRVEMFHQNMKKSP